MPTAGVEVSMSFAKQPDYIYEAIVIHIVDGDTVDLRVDLGFRVQRTDRFRLYGINAPEMRGIDKELGRQARAALETMIPVGSPILIKTHRGMDKYGRWLAEILTPDSASTVNELMVARGFAAEYMKD
jgi:micrococcal nuclease